MKQRYRYFLFAHSFVCGKTKTKKKVEGKSHYGQLHFHSLQNQK